MSMFLFPSVYAEIVALSRSYRSLLTGLVRMLEYLNCSYVRPCINTTSYVYDLKKYNEVVSRISSYSFHIILTRIRIGRIEYDLVYDTT